MSLTNCVYCGKEITTRSSEHVIQNALGGTFESTDICCPECNNYISRNIDAPFVKIFNPILGNIKHLVKSHTKDSTPPYTGTIEYNGKLYKAIFKNGKYYSSPDLSRDLRCDSSKLPVKVVSYDFDLNNAAFQNGIAKIAFNYALARNIDFKFLEPGLKVESDDKGIAKITYDYDILPFYPQNPIDYYLELGTPTDLYHNMILFSQQNHLWCYIDLFNTFQYYVHLSDKWPTKKKFYNSYTQKLQKQNHDEIDALSQRPKDLLIYAQQYGIKPCSDIQELVKQINIAIRKNSRIKSIKKIIGPRFSKAINMLMMSCCINPEYIVQVHNDVDLYTTATETLCTKNFRTVTIGPDGHKWSYPFAINESLHLGTEGLRQYTQQKFNQLMQCLHQDNTK